MPHTGYLVNIVALFAYGKSALFCVPRVRCYDPVMRYALPLLLALASCDQPAPEQAQTAQAQSSERTDADRLADATFRAMCDDTAEGRANAVSDVAEVAQEYEEGNAGDDALDAAQTDCAQR